MKKISPLLFFVTLLALAALACSAGATNGGTGETGDTGSTSGPTVLFKDDFSNSSSGWSSYSDEEGVNDYTDGGYRIFVNKTQWYFWTNPERSFTDTIIEVDGKKIAGPDENDYGVICRYTDDANFYFFTVGSDGYYAISKFVNGEESLVGMEEMQFNDSIIKGGDATNRIKVTCAGSGLTLEVNGTILADVVDSDLATGDVGLIAGSYDTAGVDILFDNIVVTKP